MGYCATEQVWPMDTAPEALRTPETRRCGFKLPRGSSPLSRFIALSLYRCTAFSAFSACSGSKRHLAPPYAGSAKQPSLLATEQTGKKSA